MIFHVHTQEVRKAQETSERNPMKSKGSEFSSGEPGRGKPNLLTSELSQFTTFQKLLKFAFGDRRTSLQMLQVTTFANVEKMVLRNNY